MSRQLGINVCHDFTPAPLRDSRQPGTVGLGTPGRSDPAGSANRFPSGIWARRRVSASRHRRSRYPRRLRCSPRRHSGYSRRWRRTRRRVLNTPRRVSAHPRRWFFHSRRLTRSRRRLLACRRRVSGTQRRVMGTPGRLQTHSASTGISIDVHQSGVRVHFRVPTFGRG